MRLAVADDLVLTARQLLLEQLLPQLPESARYQALMLASSLAIAHRQIGAGTASDEPSLLLQALQTFYPDAPSAGLEALYRRLQQQLRADAGGFVDDTAERQRLWKVLRQLTLDNLAVSNPKVLEQRQ